LRWPGVPKVPVRNSRRGIRCIPDPPDQVIAQFAAGTLPTREHLKLECQLTHAAASAKPDTFYAINEFSVHMGRTNSSVRFRIWFDGKPYGAAGDKEIIGDGFVVSTPFGSTAYFNQITGGVFWQGIGVALMYSSEPVKHVIVPEDTVVRAEITRGPAIFAYDNSSEYAELSEGDELRIRRAAQSAILYTTEP
jgi:NAD+ kinase